MNRERLVAWLGNFGVEDRPAAERIAEEALAQNERYERASAALLAAILTLPAESTEAVIDLLQQLGDEAHPRPLRLVKS